MRVGIFWRIAIAQSVLIAIILGLCLYAFTALHKIAALNTAFITTHSACIQEEKHLLRTFIKQARYAEKYMLLWDNDFYNSFFEANNEFEDALKKISILIDDPAEQDLLRQISELHSQYNETFNSAVSQESPWKPKSAEISDMLLGAGNQLIIVREGIMANKAAAARDEAASAAEAMGWLTVGGMAAAVLLAYFHARGVNRPLKRLTREMRQVGRGEFNRSVHVKGPAEIQELAQTFNRMADQLAELDKMKSDFIAHISHDLRTPLTAIREGVALLAEEIPGPLAPQQHEILEVVRSNCERLFRSISSTLDLSKMEAGMMEYHSVPCDLASLIQKRVNALEIIARRRNIRLEVLLGDNMPTLVLDEERIEQLLDNLLGNALKFTPEGGVIRVFAALESGSDDGTGVQVRVSDTGEGISPEDAERVFTRFYQSPKGGRVRRQGTGLGLAIARYIVEAHGGKIWVESGRENGSVFVFTLPVHHSETSAPTEGERQWAESA